VKLAATEPGSVVVAPGDPAQRPTLERLIKTTYGATLSKRDCPPADVGAVCFVIADADAIERAALEREAAIVRARIDAFGIDDASVTVDHGHLAVDLPDLPAARLAALRDTVERPASLTFKVVENDSKYMQRLYTHVGADRRGAALDPDAIAADIQVQVEQWQAGDPGTAERDYYATAPDREGSVSPELARQARCPRADNCKVSGRALLEHYMIALALSDSSFVVPEDHELVYERIEPVASAKDGRPYWRSYYVERAAALTSASIANATATTDPRPGVMVEFDRAGTQRFAELTSRIVGKKLATVLDGSVRSAPIIESAIRGGRAQITVATQDAAKELAVALKAGALPAPLVESALIEH